MINVEGDDLISQKLMCVKVQMNQRIKISVAD